MTDLGTNNIDIAPEVGTGTTPDQGNSPGPNPAWQDVLNVLPEQFHPMVTPHFQKWDTEAQSRITELNTQLDGYKAYQPLADYGVSMEDVSQGLRLMHAVNNNPREIYDALANAYGYAVANEQLTQGNIPGAEGGAIPQNPQEQQPQQLNDPRIDRLQQGVDLMANIILQQENEAKAAQAESDLDNELNALKQKHGDFDERFVLSYMQGGMSAEAAVQQFNTLKNQLLQNNPRPFAPGILGGGSGNGSGVPSEQIDPTKLNSKDTRALVVEMLRAANQSG